MNDSIHGGLRVCQSTRWSSCRIAAASVAAISA